MAVGARGERAHHLLLAQLGADRDDLALLHVGGEADGEVGEALERRLVEAGLAVGAGHRRWFVHQLQRLLDPRDLEDAVDGAASLGAHDGQLAAAVRRLRVRGDEHAHAARVHEAQAAQIEHHRRPVVQPAEHELLELRRRGEVQLPGRPHDQAPGLLAGLDGERAVVEAHRDGNRTSLTLDVMPLLPSAVTRPAARLGAAAQNALEVARFGGLETGEEPSPYEVVAERARLPAAPLLPATGGQRRAAAGSAGAARPAADARRRGLRRRADASAVAVLSDHGVDPWVVDFGAPEREEGGLERTLTDHVLRGRRRGRPRARAHRPRRPPRRLLAGRHVLLPGRRLPPRRGLASLVTFGSPVDTRAAHPVRRARAASPSACAELRGRRACFARLRLPAWASRAGFRLLDPVKSLRQRLDFVLPAPRPRGAAAARAPAPLPGGRGLGRLAGPGARRLHAPVRRPQPHARGRLRDRRPPRHARRHRRARSWPSSARSTRSPRRRRAGDPAGGAARRRLRGPAAGRALRPRRRLAPRRARRWPTVAAWARWRGGLGPRPELARADPDATRSTARRRHRGRRAARATGPSWRPASGTGIARTLGATAAPHGARRGASSPREAHDPAPAPGPARADPPATRASRSACCSTSRRARAPDDVFFLFEGRAHTPRARPSARVDAVVRGPDLDRRPPGRARRRADGHAARARSRWSPRSTGSARSRCCCGPTATSAREAELGRDRADRRRPRARRPRPRGVRPVHTLRARRRRASRATCGAGVIDMERIDPDEVELPAWYRPNPGRARDLAFVLFTGEGERTRANRITNRRWALSAFGTASSAALSAGDTVYSVTPLHHPSAPADRARRRDRRRRAPRAGDRASTRRPSGTRSAATA